MAADFSNSLIKAGAEAAGDKTAAKLPWKQYFGDVRMQALVELALANNRDLRVAVLNIEQAQ
ncbi:MAG: hypothetical protein MO853_12595 [Candidatus Protistobacter heckmanni]|nr:hypothetical protein [Candidatus Protistobacter heckmanni]